MHFVHAGTGKPPIVFVHGFACSLEDWRAQLDFFSATHEVVACDLRGHGQTPGRPEECSIAHYGGDVAALLNNLGMPPAILVGHSMGCRVVLEANRVLLSSHYPEPVGGIVLIDGSRQAGGDPDAAEATARGMVERAGYAAFAENLFRQMFFSPSPEADAIVARALRQSREFGPRLWPSMGRWDAEHMDAALAAVHAPLLAIQSTTRDAQLRRSPLRAGQTTPYLDLIRSKVPSARIEVLAGVGHFAQIEAADEVNRLIADFTESSA
jgi:pimeloyl-ACP methyl ester carboxylesterase